MTAIVDNGFARISKETIIRNPSNPGALTGDNIAYNEFLTINEKISTIPGGEVDVTASVVVNVPSGNLVSTNVQDALNELQTEIDGAGLGDVIGPASVVSNNVVFFDGTTGKLIKDSGLTLSGSNTGDNSPNTNSGLVHTTGNETIAGVKTFSSPLITNGAINFNAPEGFLINGKIVPSVANLIVNNSFETNLSGWNEWLSASFTRVTSQYYNGTASAQIITDGSTYAQGCYSAVTTKVGSTYAYSCYVKGTAGKQISMFIDGGTYQEFYQTLTGGWDRITGSVTATSTNTSIYIQCRTAGVTTYWVDAVQVEEGTTVAGPFTTTQGNLTVAIKTLAGTDPSATDPVYVRIGDVVRSITSALSVVANAGTGYLNLGSAELATKETDLFPYLQWNTTTNAVNFLASRIPYAGTMADFNNSNTNEKGAIGIINYNSTNSVVNIGRFAATLSAGAGYTWSVPTFTSSNLIQRPIYETRWLDTNSTVSATSPFTVSNIVINYFKYKIVGDNLFYKNSIKLDFGGTGANFFFETLPFGRNIIEGYDIAGNCFGYDNNDMTPAVIFESTNTSKLRILKLVGGNFALVSNATIKTMGNYII